MGPLRYDEEYLRLNPQWHDADAPWKATQVHQLAREHGLTPSTVLDIGCGSGGVLASLREYWPSARLTGYDISSTVVGLAVQKYAAQDLRIHVGGPREVQSHFELLLALDVFEHVPDYLGFLTALHPLADKFIFHIPLDLSAQTVVRESLLAARKLNGHLHYFTQGTALATLHDTGYHVIDQRLLRASIDAPARRLKTRLANLPRRVSMFAGADLSARLFGGSTLIVLATIEGGAV